MYCFYCFQLKSFDLNVRKKISPFFFNIEKRWKVRVLAQVSLPVKKTKLTLLKSPHIFSKAKETFEKISYKVTFFCLLRMKFLRKLHRLVSAIGWSLLGIKVKKQVMKKIVVYF